SFFTVMEFLDGPSFKQILRVLKHRNVPSRGFSLRVLLEILKALEYAHAVTDIDGTPLRLVHRDVSPHNVIVTYDGQGKLFDYGIVKSETDAESTRAGVVKGKPHYMSPEQAAGEEVDARSDLFAVGIMLWEALTGQRMWAGKKDSDVLRGLFGGAR